MSEPTLVLFDRAMLGHDPGEGHPEQPERLRAVEAVLHEFGPEQVEIDSPRQATTQELARVHTDEHVQKVLALDDEYAAIDADTHVSPGSIRAARLAAGGAVTAIDAMMDDFPRVFVAGRPPGHHAEADRAMGFCLFNNIAVAAAHARARHGIERILIVDWDVHHGNGTQHIFFGDPNVLFVSLHQYPFFPGTGGAGEVGAGPAEGRTLNIPLVSGAGDEAYDFATREVLEPISDAFAPQLVLVSAGFDAHRLDPLASMEVSDEGFARLCHATKSIADRHANGRLGLFLEGGYDLDGLAQGVRACLQILGGSAPPGPARPGTAAQERQIRSVRDRHRRYWPDVLV
jgi:acetoin utilization deacetylase AcuC-like enzyme